MMVDLGDTRQGRRVGVIDMGTNTFHLMLVDVSVDGFEIHKKIRRSVKIGAGGINKGFITPEAEERGLKALKEFKGTIDQEGVEMIFAIATSAIRNARNGQEIVERYYNETAIRIEVISGMEEAETIYYGVRKAVDLGSEKNLIMDIGGGSIEFIICDAQQEYWKQSFEIGGQRMVEKFHRRDPISLDEIHEQLAYLEDNLVELLAQTRIHEPQTLVGSSGTFDTLSDIFMFKHQIPKSPDATEHPLTIEGFREIHNELIQKTREERLEIPGMVEMRVELIVVASVLIDFVVRKCNIKKIRVSSFALKEGILLKSIDSIHK